MYIISNFYDYYDSMAYVYGVDKTITFNRSSDFYKNINLSDIFSKSLQNVIYRFVYINRSINQNSQGHLLIMPDTIYRIHENLNDNTYTVNPSMSKTLRWLFNNNVSELNANMEYIRTTLQKHIQLPYFLLSGTRDNITVTIPKLYELGIQDVIPADVCYQLIEMQLSKLLGNHDDKLVTISNDDRVIQHGFDLKKSFRK